MFRPTHAERVPSLVIRGERERPTRTDAAPVGRGISATSAARSHEHGPSRVAGEPLLTACPLQTAPPHASADAPRKDVIHMRTNLWTKSLIAGALLGAALTGCSEQTEDSAETTAQSAGQTI